MGLKSKKNTDGGSDDTTEETTGAPRDADFSGLDDDMEVAAGNNDVVAPKADADTAKLAAEVLDLRDKYLRTLADFENFRKRSMKERSELLKYQGEQVIVDVLDVQDSLVRAIEHADSNAEQFKEGVKLIAKQLANVLQKWEVRPESAMDTDFDPMKHRAIGKAKVPGKKANTVIGVLKEPYLYKDKLIRYGEVMVADAEEPAATTLEASEMPESEIN